MKKRAAIRRRQHNRLSMFLITVVVLMIAVVMCVQIVGLREELDTYAAQETQLLAKIAEQEARAEEIKEYETYTQTKRYKEEVAKEKLGLVYEGEIVFIEEK